MLLRFAYQVLIAKMDTMFWFGIVRGVILKMQGQMFVVNTSVKEDTARNAVSSCRAPSMGAICSVQVPNGEGSSSHSLKGAAYHEESMEKMRV